MNIKNLKAGDIFLDNCSKNLLLKLDKTNRDSFAQLSSKGVPRYSHPACISVLAYETDNITVLYNLNDMTSIILNYINKENI